MERGVRCVRMSEDEGSSVKSIMSESTSSLVGRIIEGAILLCTSSVMFLIVCCRVRMLSVRCCNVSKSAALAAISQFA